MEIYRVKGVYGTGLTQNKEEIHRDGTYMGRDTHCTWREDIHGKWTNTERVHTWSGNRHTLRREIRGVGTYTERGYRTYMKRDI